MLDTANMEGTAAGVPGLRDPGLLRQANLVGGRWITAASGATIAVTDPATGALVGRVPSLSRVEVGEAVHAAHGAQAGWRARTGKERAAVLRRLYELMMENQESRRPASGVRARNTGSKTISRSRCCASAVSTIEVASAG